MTRIDRDELLTRVDLRALLTESVGEPARDGKWRCPNPDHEQTGATPPVSTFPADARPYELWTCHGCDAKGSAVDLLMYAHDLTSGDALRELERRVGDPSSTQGKNGRSTEKPAVAPPSEAQVEGWRQNLRTNERELSNMEQLRGWTPETIGPLEVGLDGNRLVFPVRDASGSLTGRVAYQYDASRIRDGVRKSMATGPRNLWPHPEGIEGSGDVLIVEGEADVLAAAVLGYQAVAVPGAKLWKPGMAARLAELAQRLDCRLVVIPDHDKAGAELRDAIVPDLEQEGVKLLVVDLEEVADPDVAGFDLGDLVVAYGATRARELLSVLITSAAPDEPDRIMRSSWEPVDLAPILAGHQPDDPPQLLRRADGIGLIYRGRLHSISAEPEAGKGWLALTVARDVLATGGRVLYVDYEDTPNSMVGRLQALGVSDESLRDKRFSYARPDDPLDDAALKPLLDLRPELVVIDGVTEALAVERLNMADNQDVAKWLNGLARALTRTGAAVVLIDHVIKDKENRGRYAIGAQHKLAGVDVAYRLDVIRPLGRGREGLVKVTITKDRPGYVRQHAVERERIAVFRMSPADDGSVRTTLEVPEAGGGGMTRPTFLMERLSRAIEAEPGINKNGIRNVKGSNEYKDIALELLISEGYVEPRQNGQSIKHFSIRPFRDVELNQ